MRIHHHNTDQAIRYLATAIHKDPASMESWKCLHINGCEHLPEEKLIEQFTDIIDQYQHDFKDCDCDVMCCEDGDLIIIGKQAVEEDMHLLAKSMCDALGLPTDIDIHHYDVFMDWRKVWELLQDKTHTTPVSLDALLEDETQQPTHSFGEIDALKEVFEEVRHARQSRNPMHILLVEDDKVTRRLVSNVFKQHFAMITSETAEEAITNYLLHAPDMVFLDINLPDANGFDVLKQLIALDNEAHVVMFSGNSYLDNVVNALNEGASGFIAKPFKREKLQHYIQNYAEEHHKHAT